MIFRDFNHWWSKNKTTGFTSASRDWAKEIWNELEPTILASRDDYKNAYVELMNEVANTQSELVSAMLAYIKENKKEDAPTFWRWWLDQEGKR